MLNNLLDVFRPKRWYRNLFMVLGTIIAVKILDLSYIQVLTQKNIFQIVLVFVVLCLITSANYGINEVFDAQSDSHHPQKKTRAIPSGRISKKLVVSVSVFLYILGLIIIVWTAGNNWTLILSFLLLIISGILYNIPPFRLKNKIYIDFIFEAINNPLRLMIGWYAIAQPNQIVPVSFISGYFFFGIFLMAAKRFGELRFINDHAMAKEYRTSLGYYTEKSLIMSMIGSLIALSYMLGILSLKYSVDVVLALPFLVIWVLWFLNLAYEENTVVKDPERIFEKKSFVTFTIITAIVFIYLFYSGNQLFWWLK